MKLQGKITAAFLAAFMVLTAGGCSTGDTSWVYEVGEDRMAAGMYLNYMLDAYTEVQTEYTEANTAEGESASSKTPTASEILKSEKEGQPASSWIVQRAQEFAMQRFGLTDKYNSMGLALSEEDLIDVANTMSSIWQSAGKFYEANGISEASFKEYLLDSKKKQQLFFVLYGKGGELEVSEADLSAAFAEGYVKAEYIRIAKITTGDDMEAQNTALKTQADEYLARVTAGEVIEDVDFDYRKSIAPEGTEVTKSEPGTNTLIINKSDLQYYGKLGEGLQEVTVDKPLLVESDTEFYIIRRLAAQATPENIETYRQAILGEMKYEDFLKLLAEWGEAMSPTSNQDALNRYTASALKTDYTKYSK